MKQRAALAGAGIRYPESVREEAISLINQGWSYDRVSGALGMHRNTVYGWWREAIAKDRAHIEGHHSQKRVDDLETALRIMRSNFHMMAREIDELLGEGHLRSVK